MRTSLLSLGAIGALAVLVAACGGGGSGTAPSVATGGTTAVAQPLGTTPPGVTNFSGPRTKMSVSINIPNSPSGRQKASVKQQQLRNRYNLPKGNIRQLANVSPTSSIRAAGAAHLRWATNSWKSTGRAPLYVSGGTYMMEFVLSDQSQNILVDENAYCYNSGVCTGNFDAPVGNAGYTATLYLYDSCTFLLSAGSTAVASIAEGQANTINITLNGVVYSFDINTSGLPSDPQQNGSLGYVLGDASQATSFSMNVTAYDEDGYQITGPGTLLNYNLEQISQLNVQPTSLPSPAGITPTSQVVIAVPSALPSSGPFGSTTYAWDGTGVQNQISFSVTPVVTATPLVQYPNYTNGPYNTYVQPGSVFVNVYHPTLAWTAMSPSGIQFGPLFNAAANWDGASATATVEFPAPAPQSSSGPLLYTFAITQQFGPPQYGLPQIAGNATISVYDYGECNNEISPSFNGTPLSLSYPSQSSISLAGIAIGGCQIVANDGTHNAYLDVFVDQSSLTIQQRARTTGTKARNGK
jgi:hypothetical protein